MLRGVDIPQNNDWPEDWSRFLDKASKGSIYACDMLTYADLAYMVSLTGDPDSPDSLPLAEYHLLVERHLSLCKKPDAPADLLTISSNAGWFEFKRRLLPYCIHSPDQYRALWERGCKVPKGELIHDSLHHCCDKWSAKWLRHVIDNEDEVSYNSLQVVAAMMMLAATWKSA